MNTTAWFAIFGVSVLGFIWAKRRQLKDRKQQAAWQKKYGPVVSAIRRTDALSESLAVVSPIAAIISLIAAIVSLTAVTN